MPLSSQEWYIETDEELWLTFLFANILKTNDNYDKLEEVIKRQDPDVVLFVEYEEHHHDALREHLEINYPYVNRIAGEQEIVGNVIFSKYPMEDFAPKIYQWRRRYGYAAIHKDDKAFYFYLLHTSAPVAKEYYLIRNDQISSFTENFIEHEHKRLPEDRVVIVWDFNVSPRSPTFKKFNKELSISMRHFSRYTWDFTSRGFNTRGGQFLPFTQQLIRSHIDHLRLNNKTILYEQKRVKIPGSDHDGIYGRIN